MDGARWRPRPSSEGRPRHSASAQVQLPGHSTAACYPFQGSFPASGPTPRRGQHRQCRPTNTLVSARFKSHFHWDGGHHARRFTNNARPSLSRARRWSHRVQVNSQEYARGEESTTSRSSGKTRHDIDEQSRVSTSFRRSRWISSWTPADKAAQRSVGRRRSRFAAAVDASRATEAALDMGLFDRVVVATGRVATSAQHRQLVSYLRNVAEGEIAGVGQTCDRATSSARRRLRSSPVDAAFAQASVRG